MCQKVTQLLSLTVVMVVSLHNSTVTHAPAMSPLSWDDIMTGILSIDEMVLHPQVSHAHEIVEADAGAGDEAYMSLVYAA